MVMETAVAATIDLICIPSYGSPTRCDLHFCPYCWSASKWPHCGIFYPVCFMPPLKRPSSHNSCTGCNPLLGLDCPIVKQQVEMEIQQHQSKLILKIITYDHFKALKMLNFKRDNLSHFFSYWPS